MTAAPHVLFWDIDGTLLTTKRAGVFALEEAAREVCGEVPDIAELPTAGLTDHQIAEVVVREAGAPPTAETAAAFLRAYERHLPDRLGLRDGEALPGVVDVLDSLAGREDVLSLLLTGNTPAGAAAKLAHYGLDRYFDAGAFCADGDDRSRIARRAAKLAAERIGATFDPGRAFVIGDTPHDVRCGKEIGARTLAVASGPYSLAELEQHDPWLALPALPPPQRFAELIERA
jgi:phosphoglycolate phosphatase